VRTAQPDAAPEERITLTRAELEAMITERKAQARGQIPPGNEGR
jgi:hypothetical protein